MRDYANIKFLIVIMDEKLKSDIKSFISEYTKVDKEIKLLKDELKKRTDKKNEIASMLVSLMEGTNVDCFEVGNDAVIHKKRISRQCLSRKYIQSILNEHIPDKKYVETLLDAIMDSRSVKEVDLLVCKSIK